MKTWKRHEVWRTSGQSVILSFAVYLNVLHSGTEVWVSAFSCATMDYITYTWYAARDYFKMLVRRVSIFVHTLIMLCSCAKKYQVLRVYIKRNTKTIHCLHLVVVSC